MNCDDLDTLVIEIGKTKDKNVIGNLACRPPNESVKIFHEYLFLEVQQYQLKI